MRGLLASSFATVAIGCAAWALREAHAPLPAAVVSVAFEPGVGGGPTESIEPAADPVSPSPAAVEGTSLPATAVPVAPPLPTSKGDKESGEPRGALALGTLAWKSIDSGDYDRGRSQALECLAVDKTRSSCRSALVASYTRRGLWDEAYPLLLECTREDPGNPTCLSALTMTHLRRGSVDEAKKVFDRLSATGDKTADSRVAAAELQLVTQDTEGACEAFRAACAQEQPYACRREKELCGR